MIHVAVPCPENRVPRKFRLQGIAGEASDAVFEKKKTKAKMWYKLRHARAIVLEEDGAQVAT